MTEYGKFCPISLGATVLADRWTPLIMRELLLGSTRFNDIARGLPGISRSLLVKRLKHLERSGVLERVPAVGGSGGEYQLTAAGRDLEPVVFALGRWAVEWLYDDLRPQDIDVITLTWWMHRRVDVERLPAQRVVVQFDHTAPQRRSIWVVLERGTASVCIRHPGFEPDVIVTATTPVLSSIFNGLETWAGAARREVMRIDGPSRLTRALPQWFRPSPMAVDVRRASEAAHR